MTRGFGLLWAAESISLAGSQVSALAVPLTAALTLAATPFQMGLLQAAGFAPALGLGLLAGVWVDRVRRRGILIAADVGRGLLLLLVPAAALAGQLRIEELYAVEFLVGMLSVLFEVAYTAFLPSLVSTDQLPAGNSKLELSNRISQVGGPAMAGALIQLVTAPVAIAADAVSFLASAFLLAEIRCDEPAPTPRPRDSNVIQELGEGLRVVFGNPIQRALVGCAGTYNLFGYVQATVLVLYVTRDLGLGAAAFGAAIAAFGAGGVLGALCAARAAGRLGSAERVLVAGVAVAVIGDVLVALAGPPLPAMALLVVGRLLAGVGLPLYVVNAVSLRQAITPPALLGRTAATARWITWGVLPLGALLGGLLGEVVGLRGTLVVAALGACLALALLLRAPEFGRTAKPCSENAAELRSSDYSWERGQLP